MSGYGVVPVVRDVSLSIGTGEIVAVIGPNGAGKSTLLKALVGILHISQGTVRLAERDVTNLPPEELARRGIGYVPQVGDINCTMLKVRASFSHFNCSVHAVGLHDGIPCQSIRAVIV